jgi:hypothetical protein
MRFPKLLLSLVTAAALLAPITADAKTSLLRDGREPVLQVQDHTAPLASLRRAVEFHARRQPFRAKLYFPFARALLRRRISPDIGAVASHEHVLPTSAFSSGAYKLSSLDEFRNGTRLCAECVRSTKGTDH